MLTTLGSNLRDASDSGQCPVGLSSLHCGQSASGQCGDGHCLCVRAVGALQLAVRAVSFHALIDQIIQLEN